MAEVEEHEVIVAGAGPTGLMLAAELALAGVDVAVVERRVDQHVEASRAGGLHARTIEVLDQRGVADRFVAAGETHPGLAYGGTFLDITDAPTRHNYVLGLFQSRFEPILAAWVEELGVPVVRGTEVVGLTQRDDGVALETAGGDVLSGQYAVGCDGGRSTVRRAAGIDFVGTDPTTSWIVAEVRMDGDVPFGVRYDDVGTQAFGPASDGTSVRLVMTEATLQTGEPDIEELREALVGVHGSDFGLAGASWISRFTDRTRQAEHYRTGRVLVAGDAAHIHPPHGGQGLNVGVQDAVNLGWKLAQVVRGGPDRLLDSYEAERHPVAARAVRSSLAQVALAGGGEHHRALRDTMAELLALDEPRRQVVGALSGLDVRYELGGDHPLVGRRMPDLDLVTADGPTRVFALLHDARGLLVDLGSTGELDLSPWSERVVRVDARHEGTWDLPVIGEVEAPPAVLVRPDGHVAWVGGLADTGLRDALTTWFGPGRPR